MEERKKIEEERKSNEEKLTWEAPKLYCLNKNQTEGGADPNYTEGDAYTPGS